MVVRNTDSGPTYTYISLRILRAASSLLFSSNQELQNGPNQMSLAFLVTELKGLFMPRGPEKDCIFVRNTDSGPTHTININNQ